MNYLKWIQRAVHSSPLVVHFHEFFTLFFPLRPLRPLR